MSGDSSDERHVAIIGMAGRFPGADDLDAFWRLIAEGRDVLTRFGPDEEGLEDAGLDGPREGERYVRARGVLQGIEEFDAGFFDVNPAEAAQLDPQHRVWLEVAWEALEAAGYAHDRHDQVISVYAGSFPNTYLHHNLLRDRSAVEEFVRMRRAQSFALLVANDPAFLPSRAAYKLNLRGPAINVQTACSTSLVAVALAVQGLDSHESDMAVAGGVCVAVPQKTGYFHQEGAILSRDGTCRPYDARACGTVFGNGAGAVVLKRLADARRDGDPVLAVIRGAAVNNDGNAKVSYSAPSVQGQAEVIATAQALAGVDPGTIGYVEGHGTGTPTGDPIEVEALRIAFRGVDMQACCLGSVKGNIGHLDAAAGVAGLIRAVLALSHRQLPATARFDCPNPQLRLARSPFRVLSRTEPWPDGPSPRRAGVSSFGIGGTNAHVVLEEAIGDPDRPCDLDAPAPTTLLLSARSEAALEACTTRLAQWVESRCVGGRAPRPLPEIACALLRRRKLFEHRRAIRVASWADARSALSDPGRWDSGRAADGGPKLVMSFPGQGSLEAGALAQLLSEEPGLDGHFEPLARAASDLSGFDLSAWARDPVADSSPLRRDNATAQLATFCVGVALARWLETEGARADCFVGHSLGEWIGAHLAGVLGAEDALRAVHRRGQLMQESGPGAALAVRLPEEEAIPYLRDGVSLACVNGPRLLLFSGRPDAIDRCARRLAADRVAFRAMPIEVAVHSPAMDPVVDGLRRDLATWPWRAPERPLLSPVTGTWLSDEEAARVEYWATQVRRPVRFDAALSTLFEDPCCVALEVGMGDALTTLASARARDPRRQSALSLLGGPLGARAPHRLRRGLNALWTLGVDVDVLRDVHPGLEAPILPTYPFQRQRHWRDGPASRQRPARAAPSPTPVDRGGTAGARDAIVEEIARLSGIARERLDPDLPFSALGLDSLLLVQLAEALGGRLGIHVGFTLIAEFNTIDRLAHAIGGTIERPRGEGTRPPDGGARFRGLFPIRRGDGRLPLLLIHGDLANDMLPAWLPPGQPLYGYVHQAADGERARLRSVDALARRCCAEWLEVSAGQPCVLAGHSFGGLVAQHVAHLMRQAALPVELLILIDTPHPRCFENPFPPGVRRLRRSLRHGIDRARWVRDIAGAELALVRRGRVALEDRSPYILGLYELASRRHTPRDLDVDAVLFSVDAYPLPANGWESSGFRRLDVESVPGDHLGIIRTEEGFRPIAESIARRLAQLRMRSPYE